MRAVYIESIFLLNVIMNIYLFKLTSVITRNTTTFLRILEGSIAGALTFCVSLLLRTDRKLPIIFIMILTSFGTCFMVFRSRSWRSMVRQIGYMYTLSFLMGGTLLFIEKTFPFLAKMRYSIGLLLLTATLIYEALCWGIRRAWKRNSSNSCMVLLEGDHGTIRIRALIDTGNGLIEPISGKCVSVLEAQVWNDMKRLMRPEKMKMIPYHSLGKEQGIMEGYEIEEMKVLCQDGEKTVHQAILAVYKGNISSKQTYQMLVPSELFAL